jgi:hypothetical protein
MKRILRRGLFLCALFGAIPAHALMPSANSVTLCWNYIQNGVGCAIVSLSGDPGDYLGFENPNGGWAASMGHSITLRPGKTYNCQIQWSGIQYYQIQFPSPSGYQVCVDGTPIDVAAGYISGEGTRYFTLTLRAIGWAYGADAAYPGTFTGISLGKAVGWGVSLGMLRNGDPIGHLGFNELDLTNNPYSRDRLIFALPNNIGQVFVLPDSSYQTIHQIMAPKILIDADDDSGGNGYWLRIYNTTGWLLDTSSFPYKYIPDPNAPVQPLLLKTIRVENPGGSNQLKITETEGSSIRVWFLQLTSGTVSSGTYVWTLQQGGNNSGNPGAITWLRTTTATSTNLGGGVREEVQEVKNGSQVTAAKTKFHYVTQPWGEEPTEITADYSGTNARTTSYTYYTGTELPGN